ncbi:MAG: NAD(P)-dependent oxidoreductase [Armatimonadota bacterium]|jgi:3-hydroxyisobutyrate dehydrogenase-like beta-hydroxyacid dehydrogenase
MDNADRPRLGFIGLGRMGSGMALNLTRAGYAMTVFDLDAERLTDCAAAGATAAESAVELVGRSDVVLTSLPSSEVFVQVAEEDLLPHARAGHVIVDMGTTEAPETRRLAAAFAERGATLLDCPVSGGSGGAAQGTLRIFPGGDRAVYEQCRPLLEVMGEADRISWCGPSGCGQAVKGTNQLGMGLVNAAYLEAIAFGVRAGADIEAIALAVGGDDGDFRARIARFAESVKAGTADDILVKFPELPYFLSEARERGFAIPMTEALFAFCEDGPRDWADNMERPRVAFWHQLMEGADGTD